ncbi:MAG: flagellar protein FlaG [Sutterellaceae bacterium]|nr:flagellar protein FlaG [Burkholderiaceae bacterium]MDW8430899.1 flagellar protein FlaG [Sutterellaceae bacterium]
MVALPAALAEANRALAGRGSELTFEMDAESGRIIVKLIDKDTGEVLRQIPSPEMLRIARALRDGENGALLQANA